MSGASAIHVSGQKSKGVPDRKISEPQASAIAALTSERTRSRLVHRNAGDAERTRALDRVRSVAADAVPDKRSGACGNMHCPAKMNA